MKHQLSGKRAIYRSRWRRRLPRAHSWEWASRRGSTAPGTTPPQNSAPGPEEWGRRPGRSGPLRGPRRPPRSPAPAHHLRVTLAPQVVTHRAPHAFKIHLDAASAPSLTFHELHSEPVFGRKAVPQSPPKRWWPTGANISLTPVISRQKLLFIRCHPGSWHGAKPFAADISGLPDRGLLSPFYQGGGNRDRTGTTAHPDSSRGPPSGCYRVLSYGWGHPLDFGWPRGEHLALLCSFQNHFPFDPPIPTGKNIYI